MFGLLLCNGGCGELKVCGSAMFYVKPGSDPIIRQRSFWKKCICA